MKERLPESIKPEKKLDLVMEEYKLLVESINKLNDTRESSNNFWITLNGLGLSAVAYLRDAQGFPQSHKPAFLITIILFGVFFCLTWLGYLGTIKRSVGIRTKALIELEERLPTPLFSKIFLHTKQQEGSDALTPKEMLVPILFLISYGIFTVLLFLFPHEIGRV